MTSALFGSLPVPLSALSRMSEQGFAELASEMLVDGAFESLREALRARGRPDVIWRVLKEADLGVRDLRHWGEAEREGMAELGRQGALAFLAEDGECASSSRVWSPDAAFAVESEEFFKGFALAMGQEALEAFVLNPEEPARVRLNHARCSDLFLAFLILPSDFQDKCMRADWAGGQGLLAQDPRPHTGGGLVGLCDPRSDLPLRRALAFLAEREVDLAAQLSCPAGKGGGSKKLLSCLQIALDYRLMDCVKAMLEAAPSLSAGDACRGLMELKARHLDEWPPSARSTHDKTLALAERLDFDMQTRRGQPTRSPARSL